MVNPMVKLCAECKRLPRRVWSTGAVDTWCRECGLRNQRQGNSRRLAAKATAESAAMRQAADAALPKRYVKPAKKATAPVQREWSIRPIKRDVYGNPIDQNFGSSAVRLMNSNQAEEATR